MGIPEESRSHFWAFATVNKWKAVQKWITIAYEYNDYGIIKCMKGSECGTMLMKIDGVNNCMA